MTGPPSIGWRRAGMWRRWCASCRACLSPFWFGLEGYFEEQDGLVIDDQPDGRSVLVRVHTVDDDVPYVGVIHPGSVLSVVGMHEPSITVSVRLPEPWAETQEGIPFDDPEVVIEATEPADPPRIETVNRSRAQEMFPGEFTAPTQDGLDFLYDELG